MSDETLLARVPAGDRGDPRARAAARSSAWLRAARAARGAAGAPGGTFAGLRALARLVAAARLLRGLGAPRARARRRARLARGGVDAVLSTSPPDSVHLAALAAGAALPGCRGSPTSAIRGSGSHFRAPPTALAPRAARARWSARCSAGADLVLAASRTHADAARARAAAPTARASCTCPTASSPTRGADAAAPVAAAARPLHAGLHRHAVADARRRDCSSRRCTRCSRARPEARRRLRVRLAGPLRHRTTQDRALALGLTGIVEFTGPLAARRDARAAAARPTCCCCGSRAALPHHGAGQALRVPRRRAADARRCSSPATRRPSWCGARAASVRAPGRPRRRSRRRSSAATWPGSEGRATGAARPAWLEEHARDRPGARGSPTPLDGLAGAGRA